MSVPMSVRGVVFPVSVLPGHPFVPCSSTPRQELEIGLTVRKSGCKVERAEREEASPLPCGAEAEAEVTVMGYLGWPQQWD